MVTSLTAHEFPISDIFSDKYVFSIPSYQRPYSWKNEQAQDLFDDLISYMRDRSGKIEDAPPYFLGSIVLIKPDNSVSADVVDGQQRLTTLTLLFAAIRANTDPESGNDITRLLYEKGSKILGTRDRFRLSLRERDREFFREYVQREGGFEKLIELSHADTDSRQNLRDNAKLFDAKIKQLPSQEKTDLAQFIVTRCYLVAVETPDLDSAYRIFSVLNSRGLDLSATDILKAEIIGKIPENKKSRYTRKWEDCEDELGREAFGELFSHIRMIFRKAKPQNTLLKEFKEHVTNRTSAEEFIDRIMLPMAEVYSEITKGEYENASCAEQINEFLKWLNRLEFKDWVPPALAFAVKNRDYPEKMLLFFRDLERLSYSLLMARAGINERMDRYSKLTGALESSLDLTSENNPLQLTNDEQYRVYSVLNGAIYRDLPARSRSTVLLRIDSLMSGGGATYDYDVVTVEHVLPQKPTNGSKWLEWFPDLTEREQLVHKIGNLALLTRKKNSAASNYEFTKKKEAYFSKGGISPFVLTTQVLQHQDWTPSIIQNRQNELLEKVGLHWRLGVESAQFTRC